MISLAHASELIAKRVRNEGLRKRERAKLKAAGYGVAVARAQSPRPRLKRKAEPSMTLAEARALGEALGASLVTAERKKAARAERDLATARVKHAMGLAPKPTETRAESERMVSRMMGVPLSVLRK